MGNNRDSSESDSSFSPLVQRYLDGDKGVLESIVSDEDLARELVVELMRRAGNYVLENRIGSAGPGSNSPSP